MSGLARLALLEATFGREDACRSHAARAIELGRCHGSPATEALAGEAIGRLELGLGRIDSAVRSLEDVAAICAASERAGRHRHLAGGASPTPASDAETGSGPRAR